MRRALGRARAVVVMGQGRGDPRRLDRLAALERGQATVGQGEEPHRRAQAVDGAGQGLGRGAAALAQGVVQGQQVEQQLQPRLGRAAGVAAVGQDDGVQQGASTRLRPWAISRSLALPVRAQPAMA
jgi:hypothetical protein